MKALDKDAVAKIKTMLKEIKAQKTLTKNKIVVRVLGGEILNFLKSKDVVVYTKEIYLNHKGLSHLARNSKRKRGAGLSDEDILKIPEILKKPSAVFFESLKNKLNLFYCNYNFEKCIKIVIDTKFKYKRERLTLIKTAGYIKASDLKNPYIQLLHGKWKYK